MSRLPCLSCSISHEARSATQPTCHSSRARHQAKRSDEYDVAAQERFAKMEILRRECGARRRHASHLVSQRAVRSSVARRTLALHTGNGDVVTHRTSSVSGISQRDPSSTCKRCPIMRATSARAHAAAPARALVSFAKVWTSQASRSRVTSSRLLSFNVSCRAPS